MAREPKNSLSDEEIERRMQNAIQRALNTPPKPFTKPNGEKKKRGRPKSPTASPSKKQSRNQKDQNDRD